MCTEIKETFKHILDIVQYFDLKYHGNVCSYLLANTSHPYKNTCTQLSW